jgi:hypothetical protein
MDICLPELSPTEDERTETTTQAARKLLATCWITICTAPNTEREEAKRATHELCAALPLITTEEARLN